jgi:hypothetical protein
MPTIRSNAWTGDSAGMVPMDDGFGPDRVAWSLAEEAGHRVRKDLKPSVPDPGDWRDERVGWGVVLPATAGLSAAELASGDDAPDPIRRLIAARSAEANWRVPVLRYHPQAEPEIRFRFLQHHATGRSLAIVGSAPGVKDGQLPSYLLIAAPPTTVPWQLQYVLSAQRFVGRLDLEPDGLDSYVSALTNGFADAGSDVRSSVVWAVADPDPEDITHTLRRMIARKINGRLRADADLREAARFVDGTTAPATGAALVGELAEHRPGLIVTTSHGRTGPLADPATMGATLGLPVGQDLQTLAIADLLAEWEPGGAIWLAHACCSAGAAARSSFDGLFAPDGEIGRLLAGVAALGDRVAPLPRALLGHANPLRAFIGHVEPTFDWTVRDPVTGQSLCEALCEVVFPRLYVPLPVGLALDTWQDLVDGHNRTWLKLKEQFAAGEDIEDELLLPRLAACDVESTVLLGDPTAVLPSL